ncbi:MAG: hypothetical protein JXB15_12125, partial [Anaerolineales bacterium]|nr:hypothetical protein [Anaerolineales bacterium]
TENRCPGGCSYYLSELGLPKCPNFCLNLSGLPLDEYEGGMLSYSGNPFTMKVYDAYTGSYLLGVFVEDMDGNTRYQFVELEVRD